MAKLEGQVAKGAERLEAMEALRLEPWVVYP